MKFIQNIIHEIQTKDILELIIAISIIIIFFLGSSLLSKLFCKILKIRKDKLKQNEIYKNMKVILKILGIYVGIMFLQLPYEFTNILTKITKIIMIILITKLLADCVSPKMKLMKYVLKNDSKANSSFNFIIKVIKGLIYTIGIFIIISELGYDISGIITGLGLSGVVIALAAQDIAKNLFAGFAILSDKTFLVGDYIEVDNYAGTIEDIRIRTTRIRTTENTLITIPNSVLADGKVINWSKNVKRRYEFNLRFKLNSNVTLLKEISNRIKFVLKTNKDIIQDNINVNFTNIAEDAIVLNVYFYTNIVDYTEYLAFKSDINIMILGMLEKENIELVAPTIFIQK